MTLAALTLWLIPTWLAGPLEAVAEPTAKEIAAAVARLGDDRYEAREAATDFLWNAGEAAEAALREALDSKDAEVRLRAGMVLERFRQGYYPDISPESVALIRQYRSGNLNQQRAAIAALRNSGDTRTLWRLFRGEQQDRPRREIAAALRANLDKNLAELLADGKQDEVEQLLRLDATLGNTSARRQLTTFYVLQDLLDERLVELRKSVEKSGAKEERQLLMAMEEAAGNHQAARALADQLGDTANAVTMALRRHDWEQAAELFQERLGKPPAPALEASGYAALYHRLAGNAEAAAARLEDLRAVREREPANAWFVMEILLLNEQVEEAIAGLQTIRPAMAFELLCVRNEFDKAFAMVEVAEGQTFDAAWFTNLPHGAGDSASEVQILNQRHILALEVAYFLYQCGRTKDAEALLEFLGALARTGDDPSLRWRRSELCRIETRLGLTERALRDGADFLEGSPDTMVLGRLFAGEANLSLSWLALVAQTNSALPMVKRLDIVRQLTQPNAREKQGESYNKWMEIAATSLKTAEEPGRSLRRQAMIAAAITHGDRPRALELLDVGDDGTPDAHFRAAELLREEKRLAEAATHYGKIPPGDKQYTLALYLQGWCESQSPMTGEDLPSDKRKLALILANENSDRQQLLAGLLARKLTDDAQRVRDLWLRTSPELSSAVAKDIGNAYAPEDPLLAANYWQQLVINLVSTGSGLLEDAGYLTLTHQIHRTRAKAYLQQEKREEFLRELELCRQILPHEWAVVEEFVPKMDALGWQKEADQLFDAQHVKLTALCKAYPQSARFSNGLAWTSAVCGRHLDAALEQAQHTLTLKPDEPGYIDTLAEVHFQRKEYAEAVKQQRRAVELAPDATQLRERLTKFEAALAQADTE